MEDMRHLGVFAEIDRELQALVTQYNRECSGVTDKEALLRLRREQNAILAEVLRKHARTMAYMAGEPYEPVAHEATAVLVGVGSGSAA